MSLNVAQTSGDFEIVPEGQYVARCYKVIDLGTQTIEFAGEVKQQHKIMIYWEILDDKIKMEDGRPYSIAKQYTASLHEKSNLYKDLVAWRGKPFSPEELAGFDISKLLGAYCQLQVVHQENNNRTYANVNAIMNTKERPKAVNDNVMFDIDSADMEVFNGLSDWLKDKIRASVEWKQKDEPEAKQDSKDVVIEDLDDDNIDMSEIPF